MLHQCFNKLMAGSLIMISAWQAQAQDTTWVEAKVWSRDSTRKIVYSDWKKFPSVTLNALKGFQYKGTEVDEFGGSPMLKGKNTGFFHVELINGRNWLIDPKGNVFLTMGVTSTRMGKSALAQSSFQQAFGQPASWISQTAQLLRSNAFNTTGSWSDEEVIQQYNQAGNNHLVYTTQLSLLGKFAGLKSNKEKNWHILAFAFEPRFAEYCRKKAEERAALKNDPDLLGDFSDNELPFQENLLKEFSRLDTSSRAYVFMQDWCRQHHADPLNATKEQREQFSGAVAEQYFSTVFTALKAADPNHLYLGSRLHASAKNNPYVLAAAEKWQDVISINYYGNWAVTPQHSQQWQQLKKPFFITEFYTKGDDTGMGNISGAGWLVRTQQDRGIHYQNFCITLLQNKNCVGWHWFRYQDNDPADATADPSNNDSNKGLVNIQYQPYASLMPFMQSLNRQAYELIRFFDSHKK